MAFRISGGFAALSLTIFSAPLALAQDAVTLEPGLYDFTHNFYVNSALQKTDDYEYCIAEGRNSKTLDEIVADLVEGGQCSVSNVVLTQSTGRANMSCFDPDFGVQSTGRIEVEYGTDYYTGNTTATIGGGAPLRVDTDVRRRSDCPEGWDNPDDVSAD